MMTVSSEPLLVLWCVLCRCWLSLACCRLLRCPVPLPPTSPACAWVWLDSQSCS